MDTALAAEHDSDDSSGISDDSSGIDDVLFTNDTDTIPAWQRLHPTQHSTVFFQQHQPLTERFTPETLGIYRESVIFDHAVGGAYEPWIRVLRIRPGVLGQALYCKIIKRPLWDAGEYFALSYTWGTDYANQQIYIERHNHAINSFPVSLHLWNALQRLRQEQSSVNVWVDAICINQQNHMERAAQVNIMAQIFNQADQVRIWLGEEPTDDIGSATLTDAELLWSLCQQPSPWWKRLWILQEIAYAETCAIVMLGARLMSLEQLIQRWYIATRSDAGLNDEQRDLLTNNYKSLRTPFDMWIGQQNNSKHRLPLFQRLQETAGRDCKDPRDRIYALLSLTEEKEAEQLRPDYRKSYPELVVEVAKVVQRSSHWHESDDAVLDNILRPCGVKRWIWGSDMTAAGLTSVLNNALRRECESGDEKLIRILIDAGVDVNAGAAEDTALQAASLRENEKIAKALRDAGVDVKDGGKMLRFRSTLKKALCRSDEKIVKALINAGADVNARERKDDSILQAASYRGNKNLVKMLIDAGADVNDRREMYCNALQAASYRGHEEIVKILLDAGADINARGGRYDYGSRPGGDHNALQAASFQGHVDIVSMLIENGAGIHVKDRFGDSAINVAQRGLENCGKERHDSYLKIIRMLQDVETKSINASEVEQEVDDSEDNEA